MATPAESANPGIRVPVQPGFFESTINKVEDLLKKIQDKIKELFDTINRGLDLVPDFLVPDGIIDKIHALVDRLNSLIQKFFNKMREYLAQAGSPATLKAAAQTWIDNVGAPSGDVASKLQANYTEVDDHWEGEAVRQYQNVLTAQHEAFAWVAESTTTINNAISKAAGGIEDFWMGVAVSLGLAVVGFGLAIAQCFTIVDIPGGILTAIGALVAALLALGTGYMLLVNNQNASADAARTLKNDRTVASAFPKDRWPSATVQTGEFRPD